MFILRHGFHTLGDDSNLYVQNFVIKPENYVIHEDFVWIGELPRNDIALIKIPRPAKFTQLSQPSCWRTQSPLEDPLVVVGWGKTENFQGLTSEGVYSNSQHKLEVCNRSSCYAIHNCYSYFRCQKSKLMNARKLMMTLALIWIWMIHICVQEVNQENVLLLEMEDCFLN